MGEEDISLISGLKTMDDHYKCQNGKNRENQVGQPAPGWPRVAETDFGLRRWIKVTLSMDREYKEYTASKGWQKGIALSSSNDFRTLLKCNARLHLLVIIIITIRIRQDEEFEIFINVVHPLGCLQPVPRLHPSSSPSPSLLPSIPDNSVVLPQ